MQSFTDSLNTHSPTDTNAQHTHTHRQHGPVHAERSSQNRRPQNTYAHKDTLQRQRARTRTHGQTHVGHRRRHTDKVTRTALREHSQSTCKRHAEVTRSSGQGIIVADSAGEIRTVFAARRALRVHDSAVTPLTSHKVGTLASNRPPPQSFFASASPADGPEDLFIAFASRRKLNTCKRSSSLRSLAF